MASRVTDALTPVASMTFMMSTFGASGILWSAHAHFDPLGLDLSNNRPKG
jgi:hypothetical protein